MIIDLEMILRELLSLADLTKAQIFYIHKLTDIIMVKKDKNFIFIVFQIMMPKLKDFNNSLEFLIISFVPSVSKNYLLGGIGY